MYSETRNPGMQIASEGYCQTRISTGVHWFPSSFGPPSGSWIGFWMNPELNLQQFDMQTLVTG
jgi:hypothetical protein